MGNNPSATTWQSAGLDKSKVLERLCSADPIYTSDSAWNDLLSIQFALPKSSEEKAFCTKVAPHLASLLSNTRRSGNLSALIRVLVAKVTQLKAESTAAHNYPYSAALCWQLTNALFALRVVCTYVVREASDDQLIELFNSLQPAAPPAQPTAAADPATAPSPAATSPSLPNTAAPVLSASTTARPGQPAGGAFMGKLLPSPAPSVAAVGSGANAPPLVSRADPLVPYEATLLNAIIELLVDIPLNALTYWVHVEAARLLVSILSAQLYRSEPLDLERSVLLSHLMHGKCAIHAPLLLKSLLVNLMNRFQVPSKPLAQWAQEEARALAQTQGKRPVGGGEDGHAGGASGTKRAAPDHRVFKKSDLQLEPAKPEQAARNYALLSHPAAMAGPQQPAPGIFSTITSTLLYVMTVGQYGGGTQETPTRASRARHTSLSSSAPVVLTDVELTAFSMCASGGGGCLVGPSGSLLPSEALTSESPLATYSVLLALLLCNHCVRRTPLHAAPGALAPRNPYREALSSFTNSTENKKEREQSAAVVAAAGASGATFMLEFERLYRALAEVAFEEHCTLLLYMLLHLNLNVRSYILTRPDVENLLLPIFRILYDPTQVFPQHMYMGLIILLLMSEDDNFSKTIHGIQILNVSWCKERQLQQISLGSLLVLIIIRIIQYNLNRGKDRYLHTNCLATLANMAARFTELHPYVCQRLVGMLGQLCRKLARIKHRTSEIQSALQTHAEKAAQPPPAAAANSDSQQQHHSDTESAARLSAELQNLDAERELLDEMVRMWIEILNAAVQHALLTNSHLLYHLLYERELFTTLLQQNPHFNELLSNIELVLNQLNEELDKEQSASGVDLTVAAVLEVIKKVAKNFKKDRFRKSPELKFKYVEEENPEDFFVPYSWSLAYRASGLHLCPPECVHLFPVPLPPSPVNSGEAPEKQAATATTAAAAPPAESGQQRQASPTPAASSSAPPAADGAHIDFVNNTVARAQSPLAV